MPQEKLVTVTALARMLGPGWSRSSVWYWLHRAEVVTSSMPGLPYFYVPESQLSEVLFRLRAAREKRRHDGHGGGEARARSLRSRGGVY
jgi:hypothetical protein